MEEEKEEDERKKKIEEEEEEGRKEDVKNITDQNHKTKKQPFRLVLYRTDVYTVYINKKKGNAKVVH